MNALLRHAIIVLAALATSVSAQAARTISGTVKGFDGETPLSGAIVRVVGQNIQDTTDDQGRFFLSNVDGEVELEASYYGFGNARLSVSGNSAEFLLGENVVELDPLLVTGALSGQVKALNLQRASNNLTNIVSADAFGNFPDENAAEALQRISGVSITRDQGEGRFVVVRGIDPDLNHISVDGVSLPSPESDTRKVAMDVIPTEILERLEVSKTITPDMDGDAIGGRVNLKTISPFDKGGRFGSIKAQMLYNDLVDDFSPMASLAYGDVFGEGGNMGFLISASFQEREFGSDNFEVDGPWEEIDAEDTEDGSRGFFAPEIEFREYEVTRERKSVSANFENRVNETSLFYLRGAYNYFSDQEYRSRTEVKLEDGAIQSLTDTSAVVTDIEEADRDLKNRFEEQEIHLLSTGGETKYENWTFGYGASIAHAEENEPDRLDIDFRSEELYDVSYDFSGDAYGPNLTIANDASVFDASNFLFEEAVVENNLAEEDETAFHIDARQDMIFGNNPGYIKFGAKYRSKEKKVNITNDVYSNDSSDTKLADVLNPNSRYPFFRGPGNYLKADPGLTRQFFNSSQSDFEFEDEDSQIDSAAADYRSDEDILAVYGMAESTISDWTVTGGIRYEETDFTTTGNEVIFDEEGDLAGIDPLTASKEYDNLLAMLGGRYLVNEDAILRLSWTNTIARPKFSQSAFRRERNIEDEEVISGNPNLDPYEAMNFDISYEQYLQGVGNVGVAVFQKEIDSFIFEEESTINIDGEVFDFVTPLNGDSASISGIEFSWQQSLSELAPALEGFSVYGNLTLTDSESATDSRLGEELPFLNQSDTIANLALTYENETFLFRLAGTYRSEYLDAISGDSNEDEYVDSHFQLDAKGVYKINPHSSVFVELINLNDEPLRAYFGVPSRMRQFEEYSFSAKFGYKWIY